MVIRYEYVLPTMYVLLIPIAFVLFMMALIGIWMVGAPEVTRAIPEYSLHVMYEPPKSSSASSGQKSMKGRRRQEEPLGFARYQKKGDREDGRHDNGITYESLPGPRAVIPTSRDQVGYSNPAFEEGTTQAYCEKSRVI